MKYSPLDNIDQGCIANEEAEKRPKLIKKVSEEPGKVAPTPSNSHIRINSMLGVL